MCHMLRYGQLLCNPVVALSVLWPVNAWGSAATATCMVDRGPLLRHAIIIRILAALLRGRSVSKETGVAAAAPRAPRALSHQ